MKFLQYLKILPQILFLLRRKWNMGFLEEWTNILI